MKSAFIQIMTTEFRHIIRNKGVLVLALVAPVVATFLSSKILSTDIQYVKVAVVVPHHTEESRHLISRFEENPVFRFKGYFDDVEKAKKLMYDNRLNAIVVLRPDYDELVARVKGGDRNCPSPVQILVDASDCVVGSSADMYIYSTISQEMGAGEEYFTQKMLYNPHHLSIHSFQPGIISVILFFISMLTAIGLVREKEYGAKDSITLSPISKRALYACKLPPYFVLGMLMALMCFLSEVFLVGLPFRGSVVIVTLVTAVYVATSVLLGLLVSLFCENQANANHILNTLNASVILCFGGVVVPVENLPEWGQNVSNLIYVRWYVEALDKLLIEGVTATFVLKELLMISVSAVIFLIVSQLKIRREE